MSWTLDDLRSATPARSVRALLLAEVLIFVAALAACIWLAPAKGQAVRAYHAVLWAVAAGVPILAAFLHGDRPRDAGLRVDNLGPSAREVAVVTALMAAFVVTVGLAVGGFHGQRVGRVLERGGTYLLGAFVQQYLLQAFVVRRLRQAGLTAPWAVAAAAILFALLHAPNWVLSAGTAGAGALWCVLFLRQANLLTLSVSHGLLALLLYHAWPKVWHLGLAIGPNALERAARYAQ